MKKIIFITIFSIYFGLFSPAPTFAQSPSLDLRWISTTQEPIFNATLALDPSGSFGLHGGSVTPGNIFSGSGADIMLFDNANGNNLANFFSGPELVISSQGSPGGQAWIRNIQKYSYR